MTVVGLELTPADLKRVLHYPLQVAVTLAGQVLLLPLLGAALVLLLRPAPAITGGLILVAAAPQAIVSNYFCLLARADVALALTMTAVSSVLALVTTPFVASLAFELLLKQRGGFALPVGEVMQQVLTGLALPIAAGMLVRHYAPGFVARNRVRFQRSSLGALGVLLTFVLVSEADIILQSLVAIVLVAGCFTAGALALGLGVARALSWSRADTVTVLAAYPARSLSIATLVAVNVLGRLDFLSFAVVFFLVQAAVLVPLMILARAPAAKPAPRR